MIRCAGREELNDVARLAHELWPSHTAEELKQEFAPLLQSDNASVFLHYENGMAVGFAHCQLRHDYVEGTHSSPVGYLEGVYITQESRRKGYARALIAACEEWAKMRGCTEFASDVEIGNEQSLAFHRALCFTEANRIVCFVKKLKE